MSAINAIVISAMPEEMEPFIAEISSFNLSPVKCPTAKAQFARRGRNSILLLTTNVGMAATAAALGWALAKHKPKAIISIGSAGGLAKDVRVGEVIVGDSYLNSGADGTNFGYALGQVPGQPEKFAGDPKLLKALQKIDGELMTAVRTGQMLSSDAFVTEDNVKDARAYFPEALSTDMESHAAAQVAHAWKVPFLSIRGISDLCAGDSEVQTESFHTELDSVAELSARVAHELLLAADIIPPARETFGPSQHFDIPSLEAAMYLALAREHGLEPEDVDLLKDEMIDDVMTHIVPRYHKRILGLVAAGKQFVKENPKASLSAKDYERQRSLILRDYGAMPATASFVWPPTSQTIIKRFNGYWNDALKAIGLVPQRGRTRGGLKFSKADYLFALRAYVLFATRRAGDQPSFNGYTRWLLETNQRGKLPSGAAIRQRFGSWKRALAMAEEAK